MASEFPEKGKPPLQILFTATFFAIILVLSVLVSSGFSLPLVTAQSALPLPILLNGLSSTFSGEQENPFLDPIIGGLINQYPDPQTYPYQDPYQVPYSPIQTTPEESLPLEEQQLLQENSIVDVADLETTISSVVDGNNAPLQEGGTTTSNKIVLAIEGVDDVAVTSLQCVLDNLLQDPFVVGQILSWVRIYNQGLIFFR